MMIQIRDKYKLTLLAISLTSCTLTYFLPNTSRNLPSIKTISPPIDKYCHPLQQKLKSECRSKDETLRQCQDLRDDLEDCKDAVVSAYKQINIYCLSDSVQVQVCVADCLEGPSSEDSSDQEGNHNNGGDCNKICGEKAGRLKDCERGYVSKQLHSYGIQDIVSLG